MNIQEKLQQDLKLAMRSGDKLRVEVIRMALASLKNAQIDQIKKEYDAALSENAEAEVPRIEHTALSETAMQETISREIKRRRDAAEIYRKAKRDDLADKEEAEATILGEYLPQQLTAEELRPLIASAIAERGVSGLSEMGKIMPVLIQQFKGRADGRLLSQIAREVLSQQ